MPREGSIHRELGTPISITNQENAPQTRLQANLVEAFSQVRFLFPEDSSFCHIDKTLPGKGRKAQIYHPCPSLFPLMACWCTHGTYTHLFMSRPSGLQIRNDVVNSQPDQEHPSFPEALL